MKLAFFVALVAATTILEKTSAMQAPTQWTINGSHALLVNVAARNTTEDEAAAVVSPKRHSGSAGAHSHAVQFGLSPDGFGGVLRQQQGQRSHDHHGALGVKSGRNDDKRGVGATGHSHSASSDSDAASESAAEWAAAAGIDDSMVPSRAPPFMPNMTTAAEGAESGAKGLRTAQHELQEQKERDLRLLVPAVLDSGEDGLDMQDPLSQIVASADSLEMEAEEEEGNVTKHNGSSTRHHAGPERSPHVFVLLCLGVLAGVFVVAETHFLGTPLRHPHLPESTASERDARFPQRSGSRR